MIVEWVSTNIVDFPDDKLDEIVKEVNKTGWDKDKVTKMIMEVVSEFDDLDYYAWDESAEKQVIKEIKRRVGGVQLSMFNDPFGVPEDYNEGWQ